jgi:hypothetical protein
MLFTNKLRKHLGEDKIYNSEMIRQVGLCDVIKAVYNSCDEVRDRY